MNTNFMRLAYFLTAFALVGCASKPQVTSDSIKNYKAIGVVSVVANEVLRKHVGVTVFGNESERKDISDWDANKVYEKQLEAAVEEIFGTQAIRPKRLSSTFARLNEEVGSWEAVEDEAKNVCAASSLDALLVAAPIAGGDFIGKTNQRLQGIGIYTRLNMRFIHVLAEIVLLDCKTGKPVAKKFLSEVSLDPKYDYPVLMYETPMQRIDSKLARTKMAEWTPEMQQEMQKLVVSVPARYWSLALRQMVTPLTVPDARGMSRR